jgi:hypothetical protein
MEGEGKEEEIVEKEKLVRLSSLILVLETPSIKKADGLTIYSHIEIPFLYDPVFPENREYEITLISSDIPADDSNFEPIPLNVVEVFLKVIEVQSQKEFLIPMPLSMIPQVYLYWEQKEGERYKRIAAKVENKYRKITGAYYKFLPKKEDEVKEVIS